MFCFPHSFFGSELIVRVWDKHDVWSLNIYIYLYIIHIQIHIHVFHIYTIYYSIRMYYIEICRNTGTHITWEHVLVKNSGSKQKYHGISSKLTVVHKGDKNNGQFEFETLVKPEVLQTSQDPSSKKSDRPDCEN